MEQREAKPSFYRIHSGLFLLAVLVEIWAAVFLGWWFWPQAKYRLFGEARAASTVPKILAYQARVTDSAGTAVPNGSLSVKFVLYDSASGGTCLYAARGSCGTPTAKTVTVASGVFTTQIGESGDEESAPEAQPETPPEPKIEDVPPEEPLSVDSGSSTDEVN